MNLPKAVICDIDGTLALMGNRNPHDPAGEEDLLNYPIANILEVYDKQKVIEVTLILLTGRNERYRKLTEEWLVKNNITHYKHLYMRKKGDFRKDYIVKREIYKRYIQKEYDVLFVLEDRDQVVRMWREEGLTCLQVAFGDF